MVFGGKANRFSAEMYFEEFFVFIFCSISIGVRLKEFQELSRGVRVLLRWGRGEESVSFFRTHNLQSFVGAAMLLAKCVSTLPKEKGQLHQDFDGTKGFPGEDIKVQL